MKNARLALVMVGLLWSPVALSQQDCGTNVLGGIIPPGTYAGSGSGCKAAKADLKTNMGMAPANCMDCVEGELGCIPGSTIPDESNVDTGNCFFDPVLNKWVVVSTVSAPTQWDKTCSSCN